MNAKAEEMEEKAGAEAVKRDPRWDEVTRPLDKYEWVYLSKQYNGPCRWGAYVPKEELMARINEVFGQEGWKFECVGEPRTEMARSKYKEDAAEFAVMYVKCRLTIGDAVQEGYGGCDIDGPHAATIARSFAFKDLARMMGIGNEARLIPLGESKDKYTPPKNPPVPPSSGPTHAVSGGKVDAKAPAASEDMLAELETTKALLRDKVGKNAAMVYKAVVQKVRPADPKNPTDQEIEEIVQALHDGPLKSDADSGADPF